METDGFERGRWTVVHGVGVVVGVAKYSGHGPAYNQEPNCYLLSEP